MKPIRTLLYFLRKKSIIIAYLRGMKEFRLTYTTHYDDSDVADAYDWGRESMHCCTFRLYEV